MKKPEKAGTAFDPIFERLVPEFDTSSDRIRAKLDDAYAWCFCELCWRPTEYSTSLQAPKVIKRLQRGNGKIVPVTDAVRAKAQKRTDALVARYEQACRGELGRYEAVRMWADYCDPSEMRGDRSVEGFREHVERRMLITEWARHGALLRTTQLPGQSDGAAKPSKLYCSAHNPRRSDDARRAYQRDRRFATEYDHMIQQIWNIGISTGALATWDIEDHAQVRREAYRQLQIVKAPTSAIDGLLAQGAISNAEIARQLGISRQAVSAAIKRQEHKAAAR